MDQNHWSFRWEVIYYYIMLHELLPKAFPIPEKFWGRIKQGKKFDDSLKKRRIAELLIIGPYPGRNEVDRAVGYGPGDTDKWLARRVGYLTEKSKSS